MGTRESVCASTEKDHQFKELKIEIPKDLEPVLWPQCCIYKVPTKLRRLNEEAYTPHLISIGPLHRGNENLAVMEKQKLVYFKEFCKRTAVRVTEKDFERSLKKNEESIRHCYGEKSELCSNEYLKMILLDAVFIIELFLRYYYETRDEDENHEDDYMLNKQWLLNGIRQDLVLLENQLPYFVLDDLFKLAFPNYQPTFYELSCNYFKNYISRDISMSNQKKVLHFTDFLRHFMSDRHPEPTDSSSIKNLPSAAKLHEAGVKFEGIKKRCLTDISFKKGKLIMPEFDVQDSTELVIRNLMALEQCHYPYSAYICNYIVLMDYLINTAKDVELLVEKGVMVNRLGSNKAMANMVNKLGINTFQCYFCFHDICEDLNKHYKQRRHRAMKTLRSVYFANIWRGTSTVAAVILLLMTLLQTINSFR